MSRVPKFHFAITEHVIENYNLLMDKHPEQENILELIKCGARDEIINVRDMIPDVTYFYTSEDDAEMLDTLVAMVGENTLYKVHIEQEEGTVIQCITADNLALFPNLIVVNILGIVSHWASPEIRGKIRLFLHPRWKGHEEYYGPIFNTLARFIEADKLLPGIDEIEFFVDTSED